MRDLTAELSNARTGNGFHQLDQRRLCIRRVATRRTGKEFGCLLRTGMGAWSVSGT